jgi:uncharacterized protein
MSAETPTYAGNPVSVFHLMAKPVGPACNLDCTYCFYLSKKQLLNFQHSSIMDEAVLEAYIRQNIESHNFPQVVFSWQGGEPTLAGVDFFRKVVKLQQKYQPPHMNILNDLQTNGTLLNEEWMEFLKENNWLVGLSIDGPKRLHDFHRVRSNETGTHDRVMQSIRLLHRYNIDFNTLTVVNNDNSRHPLAVYRFLRDEAGSKRMQFIPIAEPVNFEETAPQFWPEINIPVMETPAALPGRKESYVTEWSVEPLDYGNFLCRIFDEWYSHDIGRTWIYTFESCVYSALEMTSPLCIFQPDCGACMAIEHNGDVYSCDHYVYPEYRLGNILETHVSMMANSMQQMIFGLNKRKNLTKQCLECRFLSWCNGECPKNRFVRSADGQTGQNYLCKGLLKFFNHAHDRIMLLAEEARRAGAISQ